MINPATYEEMQLLFPLILQHMQLLNRLLSSSSVEQWVFLTLFNLSEQQLSILAGHPQAASALAFDSLTSALSEPPVTRVLTRLPSSRLGTFPDLLRMIGSS